jgi:hypothetical protein
MKKLCENLRSNKFIIKGENNNYKVYYKGVIVAESPDSGIADYIAKEYGALNARIAGGIEGIIERTEANTKQELLKLNFGGTDGIVDHGADQVN